MSDDRLPDDLDIATHEAGHAVIATMLGFIVHRVTIKPFADLLGSTDYSPVLYMPRRRRNYRSKAKSLARAKIIVSFAGPVAAHYLRNVRLDGCAGDIDHLNDEVENADIEHEWKRLTQYTCHLVRRHREKIVRVAHELASRKSGTMSASMVRRLTFHSKAEFRRMRRKLLAAKRRRELADGISAEQKLQQMMSEGRGHQ